jgi:hypothetical protein
LNNESRTDRFAGTIRVTERESKISLKRCASRCRESPSTFSKSDLGICVAGITILTTFDYNEITPRHEMWKVAKCGCLVGTFAAQSRDKAVGCIELVETHPAAFERDMNYGALGGGMVLYMAIAAATKRDIHAHGDVHEDPLYKLILEVGGNVAQECDRGEWVTTDDEGYEGYETDDLDADDRTQELGQYMLDYMRAILTGMGFTKLPTSPQLPCTF